MVWCMLCSMQGTLVLHSRLGHWNISSSYDHIPTGSAAEGQMMPMSYAMAEPLNEAELTALLMASPLYHKLEAMKKTLTEGRVKVGHKPAPGRIYHIKPPLLLLLVDCLVMFRCVG